MWRRVVTYGGYDATVAQKKWAAIASAMGHDCRIITNAGWLVRHHYLRFLSPLETTMRAAGTYGG